MGLLGECSIPIPTPALPLKGRDILLAGDWIPAQNLCGNDKLLTHQ